MNLLMNIINGYVSLEEDYPQLLDGSENSVKLDYDDRNEWTTIVQIKGKYFKRKTY